MPPTPAGTIVIEWSRPPTTLGTGVAIGPRAGSPATDRRTVLFTPRTADVHDKSLGTMRLDLEIEREDVELLPNDAGVRPAPRAAAPLRIVAKVAESGGWNAERATCDSMTGPADIGERDARVGFAVLCRVPMRGGREDMASVHVNVAGNGKHIVGASFGDAKLM